MGLFKYIYYNVRVLDLTLTINTAPMVIAIYLWREIMQDAAYDRIKLAGDALKQYFLCIHNQP